MIPNETKVSMCKDFGRIQNNGQEIYILFRNLQLRTKLMKQCQEIKQNWIGQENFGIPFSMTTSTKVFSGRGRFFQYLPISHREATQIQCFYY